MRRCGPSGSLPTQLDLELVLANDRLMDKLMFLHDVQHQELLQGAVGAQLGLKCADEAIWRWRHDSGCSCCKGYPGFICSSGGP